MYDVVVIGAGPVGIFFTFQAGLIGLKNCIIDSADKIGGQCTLLYPEKPIYDIPAHPCVSGKELIDLLVKQASRFNPTYLMNEKVLKINKVGDHFDITSTNQNIKAKTVVLSVGVGEFTPNKLILDGANECEDKSIFYKVDKVDQFQDKDIAIIGGGDSAIDWALELSKLAKKVYVIHRRDKFTCMSHSYDQLIELEKNGKIEIFRSAMVNDLEHKNGYLSYIKTNKNDKIKTDILLPFLGTNPSFGELEQNCCCIEFNKKKISVDSTTMETCTKGIFAIGDIANYNNKIKLISVGFSEAVKAAYQCYKIIYDQDAIFKYSTSVL